MIKLLSKIIPRLLNCKDRKVLLVLQDSKGNLELMDNVARTVNEDHKGHQDLKGSLLNLPTLHKTNLTHLKDRKVIKASRSNTLISRRNNYWL